MFDPVGGKQEITRRGACRNHSLNANFQNHPVCYTIYCFRDVIFGLELQVFIGKFNKNNNRICILSIDSHFELLISVNILTVYRIKYF